MSSYSSLVYIYGWVCALGIILHVDYNNNTCIQVNSNGVLSFDKSFTTCCGSRAFPTSSPPLIAPYWHDFNPRRGGHIYYRQTTDSQLLFHARFGLFLDARKLGDFFPTFLFITTWDEVRQYNGSSLVNKHFSSVHICIK